MEMLASTGPFLVHRPCSDEEIDYWEGYSVPSKRREKMPAYDFRCEKCDRSFSLTLSISEYDKKDFRCPKCKSKRVKQQITHFQTKTSRKS